MLSNAGHKTIAARFIASNVNTKQWCIRHQNSLCMTLICCVQHCYTTRNGYHVFVFIIKKCLFNVNTKVSFICI